MNPAEPVVSEGATNCGVRSAVGILVVLALAACAPTMRAAGRCPTALAFGLDFTATAALLAVSAQTYNEGHAYRSLGAAGAGMTIALAANLSECRR